MASRRLPPHPIRSGFRGWAGTTRKDLRPNRVARKGRQGDAGGRAERARLAVVPNITLTTGSRVDRARLARQERRRAGSSQRRLHHSERVAGYTFLLPTVVLFALFVGGPILFAMDSVSPIGAVLEPRPSPDRPTTRECSTTRSPSGPSSSPSSTRWR